MRAWWKRKRASGCGADFDAFSDFQARCRGIDDEGTDAFGPWGFIGTREQHIKIGNASVGNPGFVAVQHIVVAFTFGAALHGGYVRACLWFTERKSGDGAAIGHTWQVLLLLFWRAKQADRPGPQTLHGERKIGQAVVPRQLFAKQANAAGVDGVMQATVGLPRNRMSQPPTSSQRTDHLLASGIYL
jgi:hypothetical protein